MREQQDIAQWLVRSVGDGRRVQHFVAAAAQRGAWTNEKVPDIFVSVLVSRDDCCELRRLCSVLSMNMFRREPSAFMDDYFIRCGMFVVLHLLTSTSESLQVLAHPVQHCDEVRRHGRPQAPTFFDLVRHCVP